MTAAWRSLEDGTYARGNAQLSPLLNLWDLEVGGDYIGRYDTLAAAKAEAEKRLTDEVACEGARPEICDRAEIGEHPFMLSVLTGDAIDGVAEVEPGHPSWFSAPRFAKAAGDALLARHPDIVGYDVVKVVDRHWRTVHTEMRP